MQSINPGRRMKTDNLFYRIFSTLPVLALELAGVTVANPSGYGFRAEEIKQTAFRLDGLLIPPADDPSAPLIFLEAQAQSDEDFYGRFFSEIFLYTNLNKDSVFHTPIISKLLVRIDRRLL